MLLDVARVVARRSTCSRLNVGAVIAREGRILSSGYNGAPAGMEHCNHVCGCPTDFIQEEKEHYPSCPFVAPCAITVHAEANAIVWAARCGVATEDAELFITHMPCLPCAQLIINAGIITVMYVGDYRIHDGLSLLIRAGLKIAQVAEL
jgi:dCMP deaminase